MNRRELLRAGVAGLLGCAVPFGLLGTSEPARAWTEAELDGARLFVGWDPAAGKGWSFIQVFSRGRYVGRIPVEDRPSTPLVYGRTTGPV